MAIVASRKSVAMTASGSGSSQAAPTARKVNGASNERRRLSRILPRPIDGRGRLPQSHGKSCQSPRVQRCVLRAATS